MTKVLLRGGRVLDPAQNLDAQQDVLLENDKIIAVGKKLPAEGVDEVIELTSEHWITPGLIDMHVHLREPGQTHKETLQSGAEAAIAGGFAAVAFMPNTKPVIDNLATLDFVQQRAKETARIPAYTIAAATKGLLGQEMTDIGSLLKAGAVAFSDDGACVMNAQLMRLILETCATYDVPFLCHAEDMNLSNCGCMNEGAVSTQLGLGGIPNASESVIVARDIELARLTGAHVHFCHISARESLTLIRRAKDEGLRITCEVTPHHLTHTDHAVAQSSIPFDGNTKMNPPLRHSADQKALIEALADGTIDAIATDHAPHAPHEKERPFGDCPFGVIGLESAVGASMTAMIATNQMSPLKWVASLTTAPAKILNLNCSRLKAGEVATLTIIDAKQKWTFQESDIRSLSKNTPYIGSEFTGKAVATILKGQFLYSEVESLQTV